MARRPLALFPDDDMTPPQFQFVDLAPPGTPGLQAGTCEGDEPPTWEEAMRDIGFSLEDFWEGYKLFCFASYSSSEPHRTEFKGTKMWSVIKQCKQLDSIRWGVSFDRTMMAAWGAMEDFLEHSYGPDCCNIRFLMERFEDIAQLRLTADGQQLMCLYDNYHKGTPKVPRLDHDHAGDRLLADIEHGLKRMDRSIAECSFAGEPSAETSTQTYVANPDNIVIVGDPYGVITVVPPGPKTMTTGRICMASEWDEYEDCTNLQVVFLVKGPGGTWWMVESDDSWTCDEKSTMYAAGPTIARLCQAYRMGGGALQLQEPTNAAVTVFIFPFKGPWFCMLLDFEPLGGRGGMNT